MKKVNNRMRLQMKCSSCLTCVLPCLLDSSGDDGADFNSPNFFDQNFDLEASAFGFFEAEESAAPPPAEDNPPLTGRRTSEAEFWSRGGEGDGLEDCPAGLLRVSLKFLPFSIPSSLSETSDEALTFISR